MRFTYFCALSPSHLTHSDRRGVKRPRSIGTFGGPPLTVDMKKTIVHQYYNILLTPEKIAPSVRLVAHVELATPASLWRLPPPPSSSSSPSS